MPKKSKPFKPKRPGGAPPKNKFGKKSAAGKKPFTAKPRDRNAPVYGLAVQDGRNWQLQPITRKDNNIYTLLGGKTHQVQAGDIIRASIVGAARGRHQNVSFEKKIGHQDDPGVFHQIATLALELPNEFPREALAEAEAGKIPPLGNRTDLSDVPLVTIDDIDAKDFDDAVYAEKTAGGFRLIVAIADVAHYVAPGSALDKEAFLRGNSVYFPGHVIPMLPEALSNNMCSLRPNVSRAALVCEMQIDANGNVQNWKFYRALIRSAARLTYRKLQDAANGTLDEITTPILDSVIRPLYDCYHALLKARHARGTLDLELPEYKIVFDDSGHASAITQRTRLDSHRLIEEMMIAANVCAARELNKRNLPALYRTHDPPDPIKLQSAREILDSLGFRLVKGAPQPRDFMQILEKSRGHDEAPLINQTILRTQSQAIYSPQHLGHFGLALTHYTHFTSPIRRYADLIVHRALIAALKLDAEKPPTIGVLGEIAIHINVTERRAMEAERQVMDRYRASMMTGQEGQIFTARISSVTRFGAFVTLPETGADGIVPMRHLGRGYLIWEEGKPYLANKSGKAVYRLGQIIQVKLLEVTPISGGLLFAVVETQKTMAEQSTSPAPKSERKFLRRKK